MDGHFNYDSYSAKDYYESQYLSAEELIAFFPDISVIQAGRLRSAYNFSQEMHADQNRKSGIPYFYHPVSIARELAQLGLDVDTVITALIHDTVEDTEATLDQVHSLFGREVAELVDGVTKLSYVKLQEGQSSQAENFRKLLLALSRDIRVLIVKLGDRLDNMRTLSDLPEEKRFRIAQETLEIYAPLAHRLGMHGIKEELESLCFYHLYPSAYRSIQARLKELDQHDPNLVCNILSELKALFDRYGLEVQLAGRQKSPYSIWKKIHAKTLSFDSIYDIYAFRVLLPSIESCYLALGILHQEYKVLPDRFKDYISTPKQNQYQSIHTGILGPNHQKVEIQIRTHEMHRWAEVGFAAHWSYKAQGSEAGVLQEEQKLSWVQSLLQILEDSEDHNEFLENTKLEMYSEQVFCFTPSGDLYSLPKGSTPIDFAYRVHSKVGDRCALVKVNGQVTSLNYKLSNGDQVEIVTNAKAHPTPSWEKMVVTGRAKAAIRRYLRSEQRPQLIEKAERQIKQALKEHEIDPLDANEKDILVQRYGLPSFEELLLRVGVEDITLTSVLSRVSSMRELQNQRDKARLAQENDEVMKVKPPDPERNKKFQQAVEIDGADPALQLKYAKCCYPVRGDQIIGVVLTGSGITVHKIDCSNAQKMNRPTLPLSWGGGRHSVSYALVTLFLKNKSGIFAEITSLIVKHDSDITNVLFQNRTSDFYELKLEITCMDKNHLSSIKAMLSSLPYVLSVE